MSAIPEARPVGSVTFGRACLEVRPLCQTGRSQLRGVHRNAPAPVRRHPPRRALGRLRGSTPSLPAARCHAQEHCLAPERQPDRVRQRRLGSA
jgi:hypothetical protein